MFDPTVQAVMDRVDALRHEVDDHWQIPRDEALVLGQLVRVGRFVSLCEIGHSYGYSTLHLAGAAKGHGGHVHALDISEKKHTAAEQHLREAGLAEVATLHHGDARAILPTLEPVRPFDFVFIDAVKEQCFEYLEAVLPKCAARVTLATDNTTTHREELAEFVAHLRSLSGATSCDVPVGNGFELTVVDGG